MNNGSKGEETHDMECMPGKQSKETFVSGRYNRITYYCMQVTIII